MNECIETDVLVIGSGIAGSIAALKLAEAGIGGRRNYSSCLGNKH